MGLLSKLMVISAGTILFSYIGWNKYQRYYLHPTLSYNARERFMEVCEKGRYKEMKALLKLHFGDEITEQDLNNAISIVSKYGTRKCVKLLCKFGAQNFNTGLRIASEYGNLDVAEYFIQNGATNLNEALATACENGKAHIVELLVQKGANTKYGLRVCKSTQIQKILLNQPDYST